MSSTGGLIWLNSVSFCELPDRMTHEVLLGGFVTQIIPAWTPSSEKVNLRRTADGFSLFSPA